MSAAIPREVPRPLHATRPARFRNGAWDAAPPARDVPEECPVALSYNRVTHAVMLASPSDLEDFAVGFSLAEEIVASPGEIEECEIVVPEQGEGIELRLWVPAARMAALERRRRRLAGVTGCGLCGLESLAEANRAVPLVGTGRVVAAAALLACFGALDARQALNRATHAVHAAAFWRPGGEIVALREDVGRHNALDKLGGALARAGEDASGGVLLTTSRVSVELVQKAARLGAPILAAVSAPTALALRVAETAGMTLVGVARGDGFEVFTRPERIV